MPPKFLTIKRKQKANELNKIHKNQTAQKQQK